MSLNQPSPRKEPSLLDRAKQTVAVATSRVTTAARATIEEKAHDVLPATIANLALGERKVRQRGHSSPTCPQYNLPSPGGAGSVEPDVRSASPTSSDYDTTSTSSSWEAVPHHSSPKSRRFRRRAVQRPRRGEEVLEREGWEESLRKIRAQRDSGENKAADKGKRAETHRDAAPRQARRRATTTEHGGLTSEESYNSRDSGKPAGELEVLPNTRSWTHGVGNKRVTVPCNPQEEVQPAQCHRHGRSGSGVDGPELLLEQLDASRYYMPVRAGDVGSRLSRYRQMGKYFKAGSVGDTERERNGSEERAERLESPNT
ncbi:hypothetical protein VPNG_04499 [Cytospora leucostoma]|uniref:Uncharacterized protein n=1 Tax=Cytospora leucostoma TaxID=1230097 RepID=A0A423XC86_9PEZI|nr:hypothetical protein VPNG_04499 [Cytospora leucostoma]